MVLVATVAPEIAVVVTAAETEVVEAAAVVAVVVVSIQTFERNTTSPRSTSNPIIFRQNGLYVTKLPNLVPKLFTIALHKCSGVGGWLSGWTGDPKFEGSNHVRSTRQKKKNEY